MVSPRDGSLDRSILALALPALGALAADPLVSLVDTLFVGRLGAVPLAALGVNAAVFAMAFVVFNFLAYGTTPLVARAVGAGDVERAGELAGQALVLALVLGALAMITLEVLSDPILRLMGADEVLLPPATEYLRVRALAGPAVLIITASHGIFRGFQDTRTPLKIILWLNIVNLVMDPVLIFGFGWGLVGAAWATAAAQWLGAVWFVLLLTGRGTTRVSPAGSPIRLSRPSLRPRLLWSFLKIGGTLAVRTFALIGTLTLATAVATRIGTVSVAAHQVASQLWLLLALVVDSLAVAAQALVAHRRGKGDGPAARAASDRLLQWGLATGFLLAALMWLAAPLLPRLFTSDPAVVRAVTEIMPFIVWMQPLNALVFVWDGVFIGAEDFRFLAAQMVISAIAAASLLLLVADGGGGLTAVWWCIVALMSVRALTLAARYWWRRPKSSQETI